MTATIKRNDIHLYFNTAKHSSLFSCSQSFDVYYCNTDSWCEGERGYWSLHNWRVANNAIVVKELVDFGFVIYNLIKISFGSREEYSAVRDEKTTVQRARD